MVAWWAFEPQMRVVPSFGAYELSDFRYIIIIIILRAVLVNADNKTVRQIAAVPSRTGNHVVHPGLNDNGSAFEILKSGNLILQIQRHLIKYSILMITYK